jgi:hypothetical protein
MSHFIKCDRCDKQDAVIGKLSLPPGWQTILYMDLCEPCCQVVKEFLRFRPSQAANLPVEPREEVPTAEPVGDKLFETAPEAPQVSADSQMVSEHASNGKLVPDNATVGEPAGKTQPASAESSNEEINREKRRKTKARLQGQDAILPDKRKPADASAEPEQPGVPT